MKKSLQILLGIAMVAVASASVAASNVKSYHGSSCRMRQSPMSSDGTIFAELSTYGYKMTNYLPGRTDVYCPLIRDEQDSTSQISSAYVEVYNANADWLRCGLYTQNEDSAGTIVDSHLQYTYSSGFRQLGSFSVDTYGGNEGSYVMACSVNKNDIIHHVYVKEAN